MKQNMFRVTSKAIVLLVCDAVQSTGIPTAKEVEFTLLTQQINSAGLSNSMYI